MPTNQERRAETPAAAPRRRGRKRSEETRLAILTAALALLSEVGYAGLTIEGIAARAGCGKQTIYRWWPTKGDVLLDALALKAETHVTIADHGSYAADLRAFLADSFRLGRLPQVTEVLRAMVAQALADPEFAGRFRETFLATRREALSTVVLRARERGDLPPRPAPGTVLDLVFGVLWYRVLITGGPLDEDLVGELLAALTSGD
ncbi:TetR/AcrR family transcriptional regulator [Streptomyces hoynatensis]|uniref:TetR/AcrR family transcriptional regulator n=1 Tax=Streptomyces hoynatensis TaxID=1141874 RepID=A0A3A9ZF20_9ACTN|nr:TetR/AcrR family transcriptional regulator [Streptomyces hoynatensis]RKN47052.1 TetR/AcrR family transcriptional regulator [Streptomyces hoynatensis]